MFALARAIQLGRGPGARNIAPSMAPKPQSKQRLFFELISLVRPLEVVGVSEITMSDLRNILAGRA